MHNTLSRLQNVFGFFTTVVFVVAALVASSDYFAARTPRADVKVGSVQVVRGRPHYYSTKAEEYASIRFDLDADLSSLFTWNTKQVYVYVTATWGANDTAGGGANEAVVWDAIVTSPSADHLANLGKVAKRKLLESGKGTGGVDKSRGVLKLRNQKPKYQITAPTGRVAQTADVRLKLGYNVQPWVGALAWDTAGDWGRWRSLAGGVSKRFSLPALKEKKKAEAGRA